MKLKIKLLLGMSVIIGAALSTFMIFCHLSYVDPYSMLVESSPAVTVFKILCTFGVLFALALPFFTVKGCDLSGLTPNNAFTIFSSSLLGFLFAGYSIHELVTPVKGLFGHSSIMPHADYASFGGILKVLHAAGIVLAVPCAVFFILMALKKNVGKSSLMSLLAVSPVLFCAVRLIYMFMSTSARVNAAGRKITITSFCLCIFFFLYEAMLLSPSERDGDENERSRTSVKYVAAGSAAIVALIVSQVSATLLQAFWLLEAKDTYITNAIYITMILYIVARLCSVSSEKAK